MKLRSCTIYYTMTIRISLRYFEGQVEECSVLHLDTTTSGFETYVDSMVELPVSQATKGSRKGECVSCATSAFSDLNARFTPRRQLQKHLHLQVHVGPCRGLVFENCNSVKPSLDRGRINGASDLHQGMSITLWSDWDGIAMNAQTVDKFYSQHPLGTG